MGKQSEKHKGHVAGGSNKHRSVTKSVAPMDTLTREDIAINRAVAKRIGGWGWLDHRCPAAQAAITERALGTTGTRVGFAGIARVL